jgi:uncharacterized protein (DUF2147 family)
MKAVKYVLVVVCFLLVCVATARAAEKDIIGTWDVESKDAKMDIFKCGDKYCGRLVWLKDPVYTPDEDKGRAGGPKMDDNNPDRSLRNRPLLGLQIMSDFRYTGEDRWADGKVYDPESGHVYSAKMMLVSRDRLDLRGYVLFSLLGRTNTWTRSHP